MDYFDGVVPPPFTIQDAIAAGNLTPYSYRPHRVSLDADEQDEWDRLTAEIGRQLAIRGDEEPAPIDDAVRRLLIQPESTDAVRFLGVARPPERPPDMGECC